MQWVVTITVYIYMESLGVTMGTGDRYFSKRFVAAMYSCTLRQSFSFSLGSRWLLPLRSSSTVRFKAPQLVNMSLCVLKSGQMKK